MLVRQFEQTPGAAYEDMFGASQENWWPTITFVLEGALGKDVELDVTPETYWQTNSPKPGYAEAMKSGDDGEGQGSSILGLPLLNNFFTVFDRSVDKGLGVVNFAKIK